MAKKQTAANNNFLKNTKIRFNHLIFKKASSVLNIEGETKAREYVQSFTKTPLSF